MIRHAVFALILVGLFRSDSVAVDDPPQKPFEPTDSYQVRKVEGWTVLVNGGLLKNKPELADRALNQLRFQLYQVTRRLPPSAVAKLKNVKIWLEENEPHHPGTVYHPSVTWLKEHGMNPDKARCAEISNVRNFLAWSFDQPCMILHELAHGFHDQVLKDGFANAELKTAFDHAMTAGQYRSVLRITGKEETAYATVNPQEYFAEATEAYYGTNDYYPFVRAELKRHDPELFTLLEKLWSE